MQPEDWEFIHEMYRNSDIFYLWDLKLFDDMHLDTYFGWGWMDDFYDFLDETLVISSIIKKKSFNEREKLVTELKFMEKEENWKGNHQKAKSLEEQIAYLQKLSY